MRSTVRLGHVVKWHFLMDWSKVLFSGLNSMAWYYLDSYVLLLAAWTLSDSGCFCTGGWSGFLVRLTCNMPDVFDRLPYNTFSPSLTKLR